MYVYRFNFIPRVFCSVFLLFLLLGCQGGLEIVEKEGDITIEVSGELPNPTFSWEGGNVARVQVLTEGLNIWSFGGVFSIQTGYLVDTIKSPVTYGNNQGIHETVSPIDLSKNREYTVKVLRSEPDEEGATVFIFK